MKGKGKKCVRSELSHGGGQHGGQAALEERVRKLGVPEMGCTHALGSI